MPATSHQLTDRFLVPGLTFEEGSGGLTKAVIRTPVASGELYLHGAHVTAWNPAGHEPVLWMSRASNFAADKPIRGGVPICFPWFGPHPSDASKPAHGYARIHEWTLVEADPFSDSPASDSPASDSPASKAQASKGPARDGGIELTLEAHIEPFVVQYRVQFGRVLTVSLTTHLPAAAGMDHRFEDALHTYLAIGDVHQISIAGLEQCGFIDKLDQAREKAATGVPIEFTGETDRVYHQDDASSVLIDRRKGRQVTVSKWGSKSTVVWNPWIDKSIRMADFGDHEWPEMVCIETANTGSASVVLQPGQTHTTTAVIDVALLSWSRRTVRRPADYSGKGGLGAWG